ncbi:Uncharacterised protein [Mycobacteroides abscessus subsp. massiliense]|nr:Uncharacterised protein [Mycobacteroides abscessus subsp. massiliense]
MTVNWRVTDKTRGLDQVEALAVRHGAVVDAVDAGTTWAIVTAANDHCVSPADQPQMVEAAYKMDAWASGLRHQRLKLALSFNDSFQAAALLQPELSCNHSPTLVPPLRTGVTDLPVPAARSRFNGFHLEGMRLLHILRQVVHDWEREVADAEHFLGAAGIRLYEFPMYIALMRQAIDESRAALETAYMVAVQSFYLPLLRKGRTGALTVWVQMLREAGISQESREGVVAGLETEFSDVVALVRRVQEARGESWP